MTEQEKQNARQMVERYRLMDEITQRERRERLARLTVEEARREYDSLVRTWMQMGRTRPLGEALEKRRVRFLVERRRTFDRLTAGGTKK